MPSSNRKDASPVRPTSPQNMKAPKTIDPTLRQTSLTTLEMSSDDDSSDKLIIKESSTVAVSTERYQSKNNIQSPPPKSLPLTNGVSKSLEQQHVLMNQAEKNKPKTSVLAKYSVLQIAVSFYLYNSH